MTRLSARRSPVGEKIASAFCDRPRHVGSARAGYSFLRYFRSGSSGAPDDVTVNALSPRQSSLRTPHQS
jgi:hypothetical protein